MLFVRLHQARSEDEKREVATRDFAAMSIILFAIPALRNFAATWARNLSRLQYQNLSIH